MKKLLFILFLFAVAGIFICVLTLYPILIIIYAMLCVYLFLEAWLSENQKD